MAVTGVFMNCVEVYGIVTERWSWLLTGVFMNSI